MRTPRRPRLTPAIADVRRAVREMLPASGMVAVGLSGGADSLALAAATAFEAGRAGVTAGAIIVDHSLQAGSDRVAERAAEQARSLGLAPVTIERVHVRDSDRSAHGLEAAARNSRREALQRVAADMGASRILLGHTLDDQAETVLLGLARGSGARSLAGMAPLSGPYARPLLALRRATTRQFCVDSGLEYWDDPHNDDPGFARVRVRHSVLTTLEKDLGPGIAEALARTALQLREDAEFLDAQAEALARALGRYCAGVVCVTVSEFAALASALRGRVVRHLVVTHFGVALTDERVRAVLALVTHWRGQKIIDLPGVHVSRRDGVLEFRTST